MANSRRITTLVLTMSLTALVSAACENQTERTTTTTTEATPSPAVGTTPAPGVAASPAASPYASPYASPGASPTGSPVALKAPEKEFLSNAARGSMLEVQLGNLAAQRATSPDVKQFGERMATDHTQLGQKLQQVASNLNVTPEQALTPAQQSAVSRLEKLSGKAFDREYMRSMISDHERDIAEFKRAASQATNSDIKQFATEALPTLQEHLSMAREISGKLGGKAQ
jgi:putative membrane protein